MRRQIRKNLRQRWPSDQKGAVIVITALSLMVLLGIAGLAVDLGHLYMVRGELQRAADAGAVAGARALFFPENNAPPQCAEALATSRQIARLNLVDNAVPAVSSAQTGVWDWHTSHFTQGCSTTPFTNAVALAISKGNIPLSLMSIWGFGPLNLSASSIAVMDWVKELKTGVIALPVAIGKKWAGGGIDRQVKIYFNDENQDTGGWYAIPPNKVSTSYLRQMMTTPISTALKQGDPIEVNTGVHNAALDDLGAFIGKEVWLPVVDTATFNGIFNIAGFLGFRLSAIGKDGGEDGEKGGKKFLEGLSLAFAEAPGSATSPGGNNFGLLSATRMVQ
jgi:hypothetical protein